MIFARQNIYLQKRNIDLMLSLRNHVVLLSINIYGIISFNKAFLLDFSFYYVVL